MNHKNRNSSYTQIPWEKKLFNVRRLLSSRASRPLKSTENCHTQDYALQPRLKISLYETCMRTYFGQLLVVQRVLQRPPLLVVLLVRAELLLLFLQLSETLLAFCVHKRGVCGRLRIGDDRGRAGQGGGFIERAVKSHQKKKKNNNKSHHIGRRWRAGGGGGRGVTTKIIAKLHTHMREKKGGITRGLAGGEVCPTGLHGTRVRTRNQSETDWTAQNQPVSSLNLSFSHVFL